MIAFTLAVAVAAGGAAYWLGVKQGRPRLVTQGTSNLKPGDPIPAWGELLEFDIELERPTELVLKDCETNNPPRWIFNGLTGAATGALLQSCGMDSTDVTRAMQPPMMTNTGTGTVIYPDEKMIYGLSLETRSALYGKLLQLGGNHYITYPYCFDGSRKDDWFNKSSISHELANKFRKLIYHRGSANCISDVEIILRSLPDEAARIQVFRALSRQSAVMARQRIRPDTDIEKLLDYWGRGVRTNELRPVLESLKRLPDGGTISLLYFLPDFARKRLFTFPRQTNGMALEPQDCHWSTMNFFNDTPDNRFSNPAYTTSVLLADYIRVPEASQYGDIIVLLDEKGNGVHTAVHIADDIVFTKNGLNEAQPWMLVRMRDLQAIYASDVKERVSVWRKKN